MFQRAIWDETPHIKNALVIISSHNFKAVVCEQYGVVGRWNWKISNGVSNSTDEGLILLCELPLHDYGLVATWNKVWSILNELEGIYLVAVPVQRLDYEVILE